MITAPHSSSARKSGWNIQQSRNPRRLVVSFPYQPTWVALVKTIPDRKYDPTTKSWSFPVRELSRVLKALTYHNIPFSADNAAIFETANEQIQLEDKLIASKFDATPFDIPTITTTPKQFQYKGIRFLAASSGALLADDRGLGKTFMSMSAVCALEASPVLVFSLISSQEHWAREIQKHSTNSFVIIDGTAKKREEQWHSQVRFFISSYEMLLWDFQTIAGLGFQAIIADEARKVKTNQAKMTQALKKLKPKYRIALTGTPIENNLQELHSVMDWVQPGILGSAWSFTERYAKKNFFGKVEGYKPGAIEEIRSIVAPYILRRLKSEVQPELPPKIEELVVVELTAAERRAYQALAAEIMTKISGDVGNGMVYALRAKQFTSGPFIFDDIMDGPKVRALESILGETDDHKFLVFSEFIPVVEYLAKKFNAPYITGDVPRKKQDRQVIIDEFNANPEQRVLFCSNVTSFGVEITGADVVVHVDTPWNPAVKEQREDRSHRTGQDKPVLVLRLMVKNSIDDRIEKVLSYKLGLAAQVLDDIQFERIGKMSFSKKDWQQVLA